MIDIFNMVDMGGIDVVKAQGEVVDGLFLRLLNSIQNRRYIVLCNWLFAEIPIVPTYVELVFDGEQVTINDLISVTPDDIVHVHSLEIPIEPVIQSLSVGENGVFTPPEGVDGYAPVTVNVTALPGGYTQKQYLEASGTQYIDTGIKAQGGLYAEVEFSILSSDSYWHAIISGDDINVDKAFKLMHNGITRGTVQNNTSFYDFTESFQIGQKYRAGVGNGLVFDGEFIRTFNKTSFTSNNNVALFATITGSAEIQEYFIGRIYSCKMWIDGVIVRDFIPCVRSSDDTAGMYDIVNDVFYANAGAGSFSYA